MNSFIKWAGGKRWFIKKYADKFLPKEYNNYIEPFLGGGAVFFYIEPKQSILNDINKELIITYRVIKNRPLELVKKLKYHQKHHSKEYYYKVRDKEYNNVVDIAAKMIYLNRTCFNGIYRVNPEGKFNVPIGSYNMVIREDDDFLYRSKILKKAKLLNESYENIIKRAKKGDFIFCDPPYAIKEKRIFVSYTKELFTYEDQIKLSEVLSDASKRGVKILMTNTNHESIKKLYKNERGFNFYVVKRKCNIAGNNKGRKVFEELIVTANL